MKRHVVLNLNTLPSWSKKEIDQGVYSKHEIELASCIRSTFLLSHNIRKDTSMTIIPSPADYEIDLIGDRLRYLDAGERSILLLLGRAFSGSSLSKKNRLTPGIERHPQDHWETIMSLPNTTFWYPSVSQKSMKPHSNNNNVFLVDITNTIIQKERLAKYKKLNPIGLHTTQLRPSSAILAFHYHLDREVK